LQPRHFNADEMEGLVKAFKLLGLHCE
jgi:hypothetical protein